MFMTGFTMDSIVVVAKEQMSCGLDDEAVILSLKKGTYYSLNPFGSRPARAPESFVRTR
jgi:hypothetical protein